ncbi:hypothetical protein BKP35_00400 [Anaerobacillus arseniciselenatis]|uniref:RDD domain-containing protein n=1 Tax=Anaerobacillus arseniciselenatis TaxID=85682 RepID=A0A1S2LTH2_9BACI|nr:RDD family protein [Anaerobacillus arseniciselenatis]OIJ15490.1 hypothetical protein BKP35_00400 [Anaerobacillus arseniciselenatis]
MDQKWIEKMLDEKHYAGIVSRLVAFFYDLVALVVTFIVVGNVMTMWLVVQSNSPMTEDVSPMGALSGVNLTELRAYIYEHEFHLMVINWIVIVLALLLIQYIFPMFKRQTIGMKILGLYLKDEKAQDITKKQYLKRELFKLIMFPTIFQMFGKEKRPLYDRRAKVYLLK